jgi:chromate transporter
MPIRCSRTSFSSRGAPTAARLFLIFARIGLTSFGGGLSGWLLREFVRDRGWIDESEFFNGLALSQALPGVNVANLAIWIGYRLRGTAGVLASLGGIVLPPAVLLVLLGIAFNALQHFPLVAVGLEGAVAAAIGLSFAMGIAAARRLPRRPVPVLVLLITFLAVGILHLPVPWVVPVLGGVSVAFEYRRLRMI